MSCVGAELRAHECCKVELDDSVRQFCCELFHVSVCSGRASRRALSCNLEINRHEAQQSESRDDIIALMHVAYSGQNAFALQQDTDM